MAVTQALNLDKCRFDPYLRIHFHRRGPAVAGLHSSGTLPVGRGDGPPPRFAPLGAGIVTQALHWTPWLSGLGGRLQTGLRGFDPRRRLWRVAQE